MQVRALQCIHGDGNIADRREKCWLRLKRNGQRGGDGKIPRKATDFPFSSAC